MDSRSPVRLSRVGNDRCVFLYISDRTFFPALTKLILVLWAIEQFLESVNNPPINFRFLPNLLVNLGLLVAVGLAIFAQIYRYTSQSNATERRQTKWVVLGNVTALLGFVFSVILFATVVEGQNEILAIILSGVWSEYS